MRKQCFFQLLFIGSMVLMLKPIYGFSEYTEIQWYDTFEEKKRLVNIGSITETSEGELRFSLLFPKRKVRWEEAIPHFEGKFVVQGRFEEKLMIRELKFTDEGQGIDYPVRLRRFHVQREDKGMREIVFDDPSFETLEPDKSYPLTQNFMYQFDDPAPSTQKLLLTYRIKILREGQETLLLQGNHPLYFHKSGVRGPLDLMNREVVREER